MIRRLKIYFIHSTKYDYNNILYKQLLTSSILNKHELILPCSKTYNTKYYKDLINSADLIIGEVSKPSFGMGFELKYAMKQDKPKLYFSFNNEVSKKISKYIPEINEVNDTYTFLNLIEEFVNKYANLKEEEVQAKTTILGKID